MTLMALSSSNRQIVQRIDKVILVNTLHPQHKLFQNNLESISDQMQKNILMNAQRLRDFHSLRIVMLNSFRTVYPYQPQVQDFFLFSLKDQKGDLYQLNSTLTLSTKAMHCV